MLTDFLGTTIPRLAAPFFSDVVWRGPTHAVDGKPLLYLTFDDGPHPDCTPRLLDYLRETKTPATFFFLGSMARKYPQLVRRTAASGNSVGNHGWQHRSAWRSKRTETLADFERTEYLLEDLAGMRVPFVRPPYGRFTPALRRWCSNGARELVLWDVMPGDFLPIPDQKLIARIVDRLTKNARPGSIVVLHESERFSAILRPALDQAISSIRARGWTVGSL